MPIDWTFTRHNLTPITIDPYQNRLSKKWPISRSHLIVPGLFFCFLLVSSVFRCVAIYFLQRGWPLKSSKKLAWMKDPFECFPVKLPTWIPFGTLLLSGAVYTCNIYTLIWFIHRQHVRMHSSDFNEIDLNDDLLKLFQIVWSSGNHFQSLFGNGSGTVRWDVHSNNQRRPIRRSSCSEAIQSTRVSYWIHGWCYFSINVGVCHISSQLLIWKCS